MIMPTISSNGLASLILLHFLFLAGGQTFDSNGDFESSCRVYSNVEDPCGFNGLENRTFYLPNGTLPDPSYIEILRIITSAYEPPRGNSNCTSHILSLLCNYVYPPCNNDSLPRPLCTDTCSKLTQKSCYRQWKRLILSVQTSAPLWSLVKGIDCKNTYYGDASYTNTSQCWNVNTQAVPTASVKDHSLLDVVIAMIFVLESVLLFVLFGVVTILVVVKCRLKRKSDSITIHPNYSRNSQYNKSSDGTISRIVNRVSHFHESRKIQSQRMLYEKIPNGPFKEVMSGYVECLMQEDKLHLIKFLADGPFTEVYQGSYSEPQPHGTSFTHFVAVKRFKDPVDDVTISDYIKQCLSLTSIKHPNVLQLIGVSYGPEHTILIVCPYFNAHSLLTYLRKLHIQRMKQATDVKHLVNIVYQISCGMKALAEIHFIYKMLSAQTCLINSQGNDIVVVGDLSYSWSTDQTHSMWTAPEIQSGNEDYSEKSDVWSFAITALEVFNLGELPSFDNTDCLQIPLTCPQSIYDLIKRCLDNDAERRPYFSEIVTEIDTLMNSELFETEMTTILLADENGQPALYGPHGYLRILSNNIDIDQVYQSVPSSAAKASPVRKPSPVGVRKPSPVAKPSPVGVRKPSPVAKPSPVGVRKPSTPIVHIFTESEDADGYVSVNPRVGTPVPASPIKGNTPRSSPVPAHFLERSESEKSEKTAFSLPEYGNIHYRPAMGAW